MKLGMLHFDPRPIIIYYNYDSGLTMTYLTKKLNVVTMTIRKMFCLESIAARDLKVGSCRQKIKLMKV